MAPNHIATLVLPSTRKSDLASSDAVGHHGRDGSSMLPTSHQKKVGLQLQVNTRHLAAHHLKAYPQCSVDIPSSQHAHEYPAHDSHVSPPHVPSGKRLPRMHSSSSSSPPPQQIKPTAVLGKRKAEVLDLEQLRVTKSHTILLDNNHGQLPEVPGTLEVGGDETNLNPEGNNLSVFTNMPPLPGSGADTGSPAATPIPGFDHKSSMEEQNSDQRTLSLVSPNKSLEPTKSHHGAMDTTPIANMIPDKIPRGEGLSRLCKGEQTVDNHQRSCSSDATSSNSSKSLEKAQTSSTEGSEGSEDEGKQEGSRKLNRFIQQVQKWADMLEDIRAARSGTIAFEIFGDEPTDCPKLLHILQEIDAKKNWITKQEAQSTRLAKNLNLVLKTCDAVDEAQTVRIGQHILDNFAQRFLNRRYPDESTGSDGN